VADSNAGASSSILRTTRMPRPATQPPTPTAHPPCAQCMAKRSGGWSLPVAHRQPPRKPVLRPT
jgi:hypothetical protein